MLFRLQAIHPETYSEQEIKDAKEFMRRTPLSEDTKKKLLVRFRITRNSPRKNVLRMSQPSVSRAIHDVSLALCQISQDHIHFPENLLEVLSNNNFIKMI